MSSKTERVSGNHNWQWINCALLPPFKYNLRGKGWKRIADWVSQKRMRWGRTWTYMHWSQGNTFKRKHRTCSHGKKGAWVPLLGGTMPHTEEHKIRLKSNVVSKVYMLRTVEIMFNQRKYRQFFEWKNPTCNMLVHSFYCFCKFL
jgi:hypothetical protein